MPGRVRVKFCGMTRAEDIAFAAESGADAIGLIFYPASPRSVTLDKAAQLLSTPRLWISQVAVLVNPEPELVWRIVKELPLDYLQFHGQESPEFCRQFGLPYIKAIAAKDHAYISEQMAKYPDAAAILLDTPTSAHGGSGRQFNWHEIPVNRSQALILAGGLSADNVAAAIKQVNPTAVDINSGVECSPGHKDHARMTELLQQVWGAA